MNKIKLITDTGSDITRQVAEPLDLLVLPFGVNLDGKQYDEYNDLSIQQFYDLIRNTKSAPKTAQITPHGYYEVFQLCLQSYETVIYVSLSSTLSKTYESALMARNMILEENPDADLVVIDSKSATFAYGVPVILTAQKIQSGASRDAVVAFLENILKKIDIFFSFDTLTYMKAGGRISSTKLMLGTLLDIKPILHIEDGMLVQFDKVRGSKNVIPKLVQVISEKTQGNLDDYTFLFLHSDNKEKAKELRAAFYEGQEIPEGADIAEIGPIIGSHGGPGILAIVFFKKD